MFSLFPYFMFCFTRVTHSISISSLTFTDHQVICQFHSEFKMLKLLTISLKKYIGKLSSTTVVLSSLNFQLESSHNIFPTSFKTFRLQPSQVGNPNIKCSKFTFFQLHIIIYWCLISLNLWSNFLIAKTIVWYPFVEMLVTFNICSILISSST